MKRVISSAIAFILVVSLYGQNENISFIQGIKSIIYIDNTPDAYFTFEFPGDSIKDAGIANGYTIGGEIYQMLKYEYPSGKYFYGSDKSKEEELLAFYMKYETDYLENEVFKKKIEFDQEFFLNKQGKRFLLWKYKMPRMKEQKGADDVQVVEWQLFLSSVCNGHVCGVNMFSTKAEDINAKIEKLKSIANSLNVYGAEIDIDALWYKIDAMKDNAGFQLADSARNFELSIPGWANVVKTGQKDMWMATFPGVDNVINAVTVKWYDKTGYKSFADFNEQQVTGKAVGDKTGEAVWLLKKELTPLVNCNGVSYKVSMMHGKAIYDCQYTTYESATAYFLIAFVATQKTYDVNVGKFEELLSRFKVSD